MENKNIIIILVILIVVLGVAMGAMLMPSLNAKHDSKIAIASNDTLYGGDNLTVKLTDLNGEPIKGSVDVSIADKNGKIVFEDTLKTNSKGSAHAELNLGAGNYTVNATFTGNDNYTANSTIQKLTIAEKVQQQVSEQPAESSSSSGGDKLHYDEEVNVYYNDEGVIVDPDGKHSQGVGSSYADVRDARDRWERGEPVMV